MTSPQNNASKPGTPYSRMVGNSGPVLLWRLLMTLGLAGSLYGLMSIAFVSVGLMTLFSGSAEAMTLGVVFLGFGAPGLVVLLPALLLTVFSMIRSVSSGIALRESYIRDVANSQA